MESAKRVFTHLIFWLICLGVILPLLPAPPVPLQREGAQPRLKWQWIQPLDSGGLRLSAGFDGPAEVRLVLQDQVDAPCLFTPYYQTQAWSCYLITVALPQLDPAQFYCYRWEVKGDSGWVTRDSLPLGSQPGLTSKVPTSRLGFFAGRSNPLPLGLL